MKWYYDFQLAIFNKIISTFLSHFFFLKWVIIHFNLKLSKKFLFFDSFHAGESLLTFQVASLRGLAPIKWRPAHANLGTYLKPAQWSSLAQNPLPRTHYYQSMRSSALTVILAEKWWTTCGSLRLYLAWLILLQLNSDSLYIYSIYMYIIVLNS